MKTMTVRELIIELTQHDLNAKIAITEGYADPGEFWIWAENVIVCQQVTAQDGPYGSQSGFFSEGER